MDLPGVAPKMMTILNCCRICMKTDCSLLSLFDHIVTEQGVIQLTEILLTCAGIKVSQGDVLPQNVCVDCRNTLESIYAFRMRALNSETEFRKLVEFSLVGVEDQIKRSLIKKEMKLEEDDDGIGNVELLLEDFSEYCPITSPKQECEPQNFDNGDQNAEVFHCDQCSKKYTKKHKFLKHLKLHKSPKYCDICRKVFYSKKTLNRHIKKHDPECSKCSICEQDFATDALMFEHIVNHTNEINVKCPKCDVIFSSKISFSSHLRKVHTKWECNVCKKTFTTISRLKTHMKQHSEGQYSCNECARTYRRPSLLLQHINWHNSIKNEQDTQSNGDDNNSCDAVPKSDIPELYKCDKQLLQHMKIDGEIKNEEETRSNDDDDRDTCEVSLKIKCDICSKEFSSKALLNRHKRLHSDDKPYKCERCSKRYSRQDQLVQHMKWHDGIKPYICSYCSKGFNQLCSLKDHIRTHTGETPYLCSECGKSFSNNSNLRQHVMRHSGVKPFKCNLCPKSFATKGQMMAHVTTHTGAHPYKCDECGSSFTKPNSLKKHKNIHLGVKPFVCETCNMRFACKEHLKRHTRIHTGEKPYSCSYCERAFTQSNDLAKHIRTHVGQNIYQCSVCSLRFRLLSELKQHYPTHYVSGDEVPKIPISKGVEAPVLILKPQEPVEPPPEIKHTDPRITITINSNGLDKNGLAGDITINLSPEKS